MQQELIVHLWSSERTPETRELSLLTFLLLKEIFYAFCFQISPVSIEQKQAQT